MTHPVIIAGAGIGGLTAALALAQRGFSVILAEKAAWLEEVGAGIQLSPNATHVLAALGVLDAVRSHAFEPQELTIRSARHGGTLAHVPLGATAAGRYGAPYLLVHRADIQRALLDAVHAMPAISLRLGTRVSSVSQEGGKLQVTLAQGATPPETLEAHALIGADGVRSATRQTILNGPAPVFSGRTAYRATVPASLIPPQFLAGSGIWFGRKAHLVHYPLRQGREFNLVALVEEDWDAPGWSEPASKENLLQRFARWPEPAQNLLRLPDEWLRWALRAVDAGGIWQKGRIALLGDACHAMLPFAAQGAAMAIEDGIVLAHHLAVRPDQPAAALQAYVGERQPRSAKVQQTAATNSTIYHLGLPASLARDTVLRLSSPQSLLQRMDWIYGWRPPAHA